MAVWQYRFSLLPREGIRKAMGSIPESLEEYKPVDPANFDENREYPNYWEGIDRRDFVEQIGRILPETKSWSAEARMFGEDEGDRIQCWDDDVACAVDVRHFSMKYVEQLCALAQKSDCLLVLNEGGQIVEPDLASLLERISHSRAYAFCAAPGEFLVNLGREQDRRKE